MYNPPPPSRPPVLVLLFDRLASLRFRSAPPHGVAAELDARVAPSGGVPVVHEVPELRLGLLRLGRPLLLVVPQPPARRARAKKRKEKKGSGKRIKRKSVGRSSAFVLFSLRERRRARTHSATRFTSLPSLSSGNSSDLLDTFISPPAKKLRWVGQDSKPSKMWVACPTHKKKTKGRQRETERARQHGGPATVVGRPDPTSARRPRLT